jgi:ABC-type lipoprotein release transport system permease subunit
MPFAAVCRREDNAMMVVLMLILVFAFFALFAGLVHFCERIIRPR